MGACGRWQGKLPRVTIQMPVYLEGFDFVIRPSIKSLQAAVAAYKAEGGSASIFVNDDGLQLLSERDRYTIYLLVEDRACRLITCATLLL